MKKGLKTLSRMWMLIAFSIPILLYAQEIHTIKLVPNSRYSKNSDVDATTKMNMNGQDYIYSVKANMKTDFDIGNKSSDGYNVKITLNAINTELSSNGVKMSFDSKKDTTELSDSIFAKPLSDILGKSDQIIVDSLGNIIRSDTSSIHQKANEYLTSTLLLGNDYTIGKKLDILFSFKDSVKAGTEWTDSLSWNDGYRLDTFRIEKIFNHIIYIQQHGKINRTLSVMQGGQAEQANFEGTTQASLQVDQTNQILINRTMQTHIQSQIHVNKIDIPISSDILLKENVQ